MFQSVRSVCNSSRCSPKIAGRLSCKKSVNICANSVTVQTLRNFDSFNFSLVFCLCFPLCQLLPAVQSKTKNLSRMIEFLCILAQIVICNFAPLWKTKLDQDAPKISSIQKFEADRAINGIQTLGLLMPEKKKSISFCNLRI